MKFNYSICRNPKSVLDKACALAQDKVVLSGDEREGHFTGLFEGTYCFDGECASIKITKKPMFMSWATVDKGLKYLVA